MTDYPLHSRTPAIVMTVIVSGLGVLLLSRRSLVGDADTRLGEGSTRVAIVVVTLFCGPWVRAGIPTSSYCQWMYQPVRQAGTWRTGEATR